MTVTGPADVQSPYCNQFKAKVSGTGDYDSTVQWSVNDVLGGSPTSGTIDSTGDYCAPSEPPAANPVTIKAVANGDATKSATETVQVIQISISPLQARMYVNDTQQFTASVSGAANNDVVWEVNQVVGGNSTLGTISSTGLYTAPAEYTNAGIAVAVYSTDPTVEASANIQLSGRIQISPANPQLSFGATQQFTANIIGAPSGQITWRAVYGTINSSGLYTAGGNQSPDTITASTTDANGSTTVEILSAKPTIASLSPQPAGAFDTLTITGSNLNPLLTAVFTDVIGGHIFVPSYNVTSTSATVPVPEGAVSANFYVTSAQGSLTAVQSNTVQFQRLARLRVYAPVRDVAAGESVTLQYALMGDSTPVDVTFSADAGTFSGNTYTAPPVTSDTFAHVTGCISGTQSCDSLILGLHPFRISPDVPLVPAGQSLQLSAEIGSGTTSANWDLLAGGGSVDSNGLYTAGTTSRSGGPALISAVSGGITETTSVGVRGKGPGLINRIYEYADEHGEDFQGVYPYGMAVIGNRLYVLASNYIGGHTDSYYWFDVYDISDPLHPVWLTAAEANSSGPIYASGQYLYSYQGDLEVPPGSLGGLSLYSVASGVPILVGHTGMGQVWNLASSQGIVTGIAYNHPEGALEIYLYNVTSGTIAFQDLTLPLPSDANYFMPDASIVNGNRLFVSIQKNDNSGGVLLTYDLSTSPPTFVGEVDGRSLGFYTSGNYLFTALGGMEVYDISSGMPQLLSYIDGINAANLHGNQLLAYTAQQGCLLLDFSNPQAPKITSTLFDGVITGCSWPAFVGGYVYASEYVGGIGIYDATPGGPVTKTTLYGGGYGFSEGYDLLLQPPYLYAANATDFGADLNVYDTSTNPAIRVGDYLDPTQEGFALQSSGNYVYLGGSNNLDVFDVTQPSSPSLIATVPVPAISMAKVNTTLYAGTNTNQLAVLGLSNPALPNILGTISLPDLPIHVRVSGSLLLVADNLAGLFIYDISNPHAPLLLSQVTGLASAADVTVVGTTAFVAADTDGLAIFDISNPLAPVLLSKTSLSRIDPFFNEDPFNEAISVSANNGLVYVGTLYDNGLVFGLDCTNRAAPRIVSVVGYGDFILTWIGAMAFSGTDMYVAGSLGFAYPVIQADVSKPFDSINLYFPPLALQSVPPPPQARRRVGKLYPPGKQPRPRFQKSIR